MRTSILFLVLVVVGILPSCHVYESTSEDVNGRPSLGLSYIYLNDSSVNTLYDEVKVLDVRVFDSDGLSVTAGQVLQEQMERYCPLYGVIEGQYDVVSFGNLDRSVVRGDSVYFSAQGGSCDAVFHHRSLYSVARGPLEYHSAQLSKLYYVIDLEVRGLMGFSDSGIEHCSVEFMGLPLGYTFDGIAFGLGSVFPSLWLDGDSAVSHFNVPRFTSTNDVSLAISHRGETLGIFALSSLLSDGNSGLDFLNSRDVVIPLLVEVTTAGVTLTINGWEAAVVQFENVGG